MSEFKLNEHGELDIEDPIAEPDWDSSWEPDDDDDPPPDDDDDPAPDDDEEMWLAGLPDDVRAEFLAGAWTGEGEAIPAGFLHRDRGCPSGAGFASGGTLDRLEPGPLLALMAADFTTEGHERLGESELIGVLCAWRRLSSWAAAGEAAAVTTLAKRRAAQSAERKDKHLAEHVDDEIAAALTLTGRAAGRLSSIAAGLARLPHVLDALKHGKIDWAKACVFVDELAALADEQAQAVGDKLLGRAEEITTAQLRSALRRAVLAVDADAASRRRTEARKDTEVQFWDEPSGNAGLAGRELPQADAIVADCRLTALAKWLSERGARGTISQLRAEVFIAVLAGRPVESLLPVPPKTSAAAGKPVPPVSGTINLIVPMSAWLGGTLAAEVAGFGPVDATTGLELAATMGPAARWCVTVTDRQGRAFGHACARSGPAAGEPVIRWAAGLRDKLQILETMQCDHARQSTRYAPPRSLRHLVCIRQRTCSFPGCRRPAIRCDLDHTVPFDQGGRTCQCNLAPLCRGHHGAKQAAMWHLEQHAPGRMTWRMPSGRTYQASGDLYPVR